VADKLPRLGAVLGLLLVGKLLRFALKVELFLASCQTVLG
jgi:hypothetical protein